MRVHTLRAVPSGLSIYSRFPRSALSLRFITPLSMARIKKSPPKPVPRTRGKELSASKATRELEELNRVGIALSETRDVEQLLDLMLKNAREISAADAGSLHLVENGGVSAEGGLRVTQLRLKRTHNDSGHFPFIDLTLPPT